MQASLAAAFRSAAGNLERQGVAPLTRRAVFPIAGGLILPLALSRPARAAGPVVRVGVQKYGTLVLGYGVLPMTPGIVADQQKIADTFLALRLTPAPVVVSDAIWHSAA